MTDYLPVHAKIALAKGKPSRGDVIHYLSSLERRGVRARSCLKVAGAMRKSMYIGSPTLRCQCKDLADCVENR